MGLESDKPQGFELIVDGRAYLVGSREITGFDIRAIAAVRPQIAIVLEGTIDHDRVIGDDDSIDLSRGAVVFSRPPTAFGRLRL